MQFIIVSTTAPRLRRAHAQIVLIDKIYTRGQDKAVGRILHCKLVFSLLMVSSCILAGELKSDNISQYLSQSAMLLFDSCKALLFTGNVAVYQHISFSGWLVSLWNFCCTTVVQHQLTCLWSYSPGLCASCNCSTPLIHFAILIAENCTSFLSL